MIAALVVAAGAGAEAGSLSLTWNAPATNADGTPVTDLAEYRLYLGTSVPTCPSSSFHTVSSPTPAPTSGQTVSTLVEGLGAGTTYYARVTAVDLAGNESGCSASASGAARSNFTVTPTSTTSFGTVTVDTTVDRIFTVQNTGTASIPVTASVGAPFSIVSGASFSLAAGASQNVTVRFRPTTVGSFAGNVNFTSGGDTLSRAVSGSSTGSLTLSVQKNGTGTGTVTSSPAGIACGNDCTESVTAGTTITLTAAASSGSTFAGWSGACSGAASCSVTVNSATAVTATFDTARVDSPLELPVPVVKRLWPASAVAGSAGLTLTVNGKGFVLTSTVQWNGSTRATTFVSATQLRAAITASDLAAVGSVGVTVYNPPPGGGTSKSASFTVTTPTTKASPSSSTPPAAPGNPTVTLRTADATGVTFDIAWSAASGAASYRYTAAFNDGSAAQQGSVTGLLTLQLRMPYHASGAASGGFVCIRSVSATGLQSADHSCSGLAVPAPPPPPPAPVSSSLSPTSAVAGSVGLTLTVNGSGFVTTSVVRWNGAARTTTFVSATQLRATISTADLAAAGSVGVSVFTPAPGGGTSGNLSFVVTAPPAPSSTASSPPDMPGHPTVTLRAVDATGVTFDIAWRAASGAASYTYVAAFSDGSARQEGSVTVTSMQLRMPYHRTGAAFGGFVCIQSVSAAGLQSTDYACNALKIPARQ